LPAHLIVFKSRTDVQQGWRETVLLSQIKEGASRSDGLPKGSGVLASAADMKRDSDDVKAKVRSQAEKSTPLRRRGSELGVEAANRLRIIDSDANHHACLREDNCNFFKLGLRPEIVVSRLGARLHRTVSTLCGLFCQAYID
jgi:hypothetical protein